MGQTHCRGHHRGRKKLFCKEHSFVNDKKIGCIGASYGGFMTQYLQTLTDIFAAAVSHAGISNVTSYWGEGFWGYSYNSVAAAKSYPWTDRNYSQSRDRSSMPTRSIPSPPAPRHGRHQCAYRREHPALQRPAHPRTRRGVHNGAGREPCGGRLREPHRMAEHHHGMVCQMASGRSQMVERTLRQVRF